jgi:hypothetical protein
VLGCHAGPLVSVKRDAQQVNVAGGGNTCGVGNREKDGTRADAIVNGIGAADVAEQIDLWSTEVEITLARGNQRQSRFPSSGIDATLRIRIPDARVRRYHMREDKVRRVQHDGLVGRRVEVGAEQLAELPQSR